MSVTDVEQTVQAKTMHVRFPHLVQRPERKFSPLAMFKAGMLAGAQKADTYDWDTVFAIRFADANKALAKPGATPTTFAAQDPTSNTSASGTFGPWQLNGGDGVLLHMAIPITSGTLSYEGKTHDLSGTQLTIELQLKDLPQDPSGVSGKHDVVADASKAVSVTEVKNMPGNPGFIIEAVTGGMLAKWFNDNLDSFTHAFSTIDLKVPVDEQFKWLKPFKFGWAVSAQGKVDDNVFGVLTTTDERPAPSTMQISPNAIPTGQRAGFLISDERFLTKLLLPGVHVMFSGATEADFEIVNDGTMIRNKNTVYMEEVELSTGKYRPKLEPNTVQIHLEANEIVVDLKKAVIDFSPGITITMTYTAYSSLKLDRNSKNEQILVYEEASPPISDHNVEVASWVIWTEVAASVAAAVLTLGAGMWFKTAIKRVAVRVVAIVVTLVIGELIANIAAIITAVAAGNKDKIPPINLMMLNATKAITWPGSTGFELTSAALNESLQFGGDPKFAH